MRSRNAALAAAGVRLRLERRGGCLGLRGPLPCRDGRVDLAGFKVQRLSLALPASAAGLIEAEARLLQLQAQLVEGRFDWQQQRPRPPAAQPPGLAPTPSGSVPAAASSPAGQSDPGAACLAVARPDLQAELDGFEQAFFADPRRRRQIAGSRSTWRAAYRPYLRRLLLLAAGQPQLSEELLVQVLESYALASRSRQQCGIALAALAEHGAISLPGDWRERSGGYGLHVARFRQLPLDGAIAELVERIPNPGWRLAYGLMAAYGLRNHEVFFCDFSALAPGGDRVLRVLPTSKTGEHQVWPFQPEWVERFDLERLGREPQALPAVGLDLRRTTLKQVGQRVAEQFRRYDLPITPYDLRHAWAVRTIHIGLPDTVAARMMGHSVMIHTRTYHHWITRRDQQQAVDAALARMRAA
ncbi:MAG: site-specific integrase [Synechococcaceae cyanobacterium ELA263]